MFDLDAFLEGAFLRGASDLHMELGGGFLTVRERRAQGMERVAELDAASGRRVLASLQAQAGLRFEEDGRPQDGRIVREGVEFRISWLPTSEGLSVVLRVLPRAQWNMFDSDVLSWYLEAGVTLDLLTRLAEVRMAVEPEAAALAARRRTPKQADALIYWADKMAEDGQTAQEFAQNDLEFHRVVAAASGNPFMVSLSAVVEVALTASFTISSPVEGGAAFDRAVRLHRNIAEAIVEQEADVARVAMRQAIQSGVDRAYEALKPNE